MLSITKKRNGADDKQGMPAAVPPLDVLENDKEFLVLADMPGVPQDAVTVRLESDRLLLEGAGALRKFRRELVMPPSVDSDHVEASMKAGVLTVHLPKRAPYQPRHIAVRSA